MPRTGGIYTLPPGYLAVTGETIQPSSHNPPLEDIAQALTDSLPRDGSAGMSGDLPMGGNQITGLGAATAAGHAVRMDQTVRGDANGVALLPVGTQAVPAAQFGNANNGIFWVLGSGPVFTAGGSVVGQLAGGTALTSLTSLVTRQAGDERYVQQTLTLTGGDGINAIGNLTVGRTISVDNSVVRTSRQIIGGSGMANSTTGNLASNVTVTLGTPSSITATSTNSVTATSHTHDLPESAVRTLIAQGSAGQVGTYAFLQVVPGGVLAFGQSVAGSQLSVSNGEGNPVGGTVGGTWECMGFINGGGTGSRSSLFKRNA